MSLYILIFLLPMLLFYFFPINFSSSIFFFSLLASLFSFISIFSAFAKRLPRRKRKPACPAFCLLPRRTNSRKTAATPATVRRQSPSARQAGRQPQKQSLQQLKMVFGKKQQTLVPQAAKLLRKAAAVNTQIIRQLLA